MMIAYDIKKMREGLLRQFNKKRYPSLTISMVQVIHVNPGCNSAKFTDQERKTHIEMGLEPNSKIHLADQSSPAIGQERQQQFPN